MTGSDSSRPSHPVFSRLPPSPSASEVRDLAAVLDDARRLLWHLSSATPRTRCARAAYAAREDLGNAATALQDLARCLDVDAIVRLVPEQE